MARPRARLRILHRSIQAASLALLLFLLGATVFPPVQELLPVDLYLRLDPLVATLTPVAAREWIAALWPGLGLLLLTLLFGRLFCGYICPMGITLDVARWLGGALGGKARKAANAGSRIPRDPHGDAGEPARQKSRKRATVTACIDSPAPFPANSFRQTKYVLLLFLAVTALLGVNIIFWASPIPLVTRFYVLVLHPILTFVGNLGLQAAQPLLSSLDMTALSYLQITPRRFQSLFFVLLLFLALFTMEGIKPRFWCRYLCPAGALLGLFSRRPLWRRRVHGCEGCGSCVRACPTGAIHQDGVHSDFTECITCRACQERCPTGGVRFALREIAPDGTAREHGGGAGGQRAFQLSRRRFMATSGLGVVYSLASYSTLNTMRAPLGRGTLWSNLCVRPPGALPEVAFLDRCLRCGQCMKACPTNALQPLVGQVPLDALFSPVIVARRGACEPECNACGRVCPTGAIHNLPLEQKQWAKVGTAVVLREQCLAWAENRACVVCEEVCPYGAITCERRAESPVSAPVVRADRCFGCGYCEQHCPVRTTAIVVRPLNALRLYDTEYISAGKSIGLHIAPASKADGADAYPAVTPEGELPPGFSE